MSDNSNQNKKAGQKPKVCSDEYFCEVCGHYPLTPIHGHFECLKCRYKTKCCEGA